MEDKQKNKLKNSIINRINKLNKVIIPKLETQINEIKTQKGGFLTKIFMEQELDKMLGERDMLLEKLTKLKTLMKK